MRVILNGIEDLPGMLKAAERAMSYEAGTRSVDGTDKLKDMGLRVDGKYYFARFNKASVSVWRSDE
jgi:hypothetical protein